MSDDATFTLTLSRKQLTHLRDLMSLRLPPEYRQTVSADLARCTRRSPSEVALWQAVYELCVDAKLAVDADAPDFTLWSVVQPRLEVMKFDPNEVGEVVEE